MGGKKKKGKSLPPKWEEINKILDIHLTKYYKLYLKLILSLSFLFILFLFDPKLGTGGDNVRYIATAESLITKFEYRNIMEPGEPPFGIHPPGYALLLAPSVRLFPKSIIPLKLLSLVFLIASFIMLSFILKRNVSLMFCFIVLLLSITCYHLLEFSSTILSEAPYIFFTFLSIFLVKSAVEKQESWINYLLVSIFLVYSYYIRVIGISIVVAGFAYFLYKKRYKGILVLGAVSLLLIGGWYIRNHLVNAPNYYLEFFLAKDSSNLDAGKITFSDLIYRTLCVTPKKFMLQEIPTIIFSSQKFFYKTSLRSIFSGGVIVLLFFVGFSSRIIKHRSFIEFYVFFYGGVLLIQPPFNVILRYLVPIYPFIVLYTLYGIERITKWCHIRGGIFILSIFSLLMFVGNIKYLCPRVSSNVKNTIAYINGDKYAGYSLAWIRFIEANKWIDENTPKNSILISRKPTLTYFYANRKTIRYLYTKDAQKLYNKLVQQRVDYVIVDRISWKTIKYLVPTINTYPDRFQFVYKTLAPENYVFKIKE